MPTGRGDSLMSRKIINTNPISRIEGDASFIIELKDKRPEDIKLRVFEAPRFFEGFLIGRTPQEAIDFTARICGICPVAYQMSAVHAIEKLYGIEVSEEIKALRRLLYCGEWIESHCLHIYLLQGPDFYNLTDAWSSKDYIDILKKGLSMKRVGNKLIEIIGGRSIHPVSVKIGGFYNFPEKRQLTELLPEIERAYEESLKMIRWASSLHYPELEMEQTFLSLGDMGEYPMNYGLVISNSGLKIEMDQFLALISEFQLPYSNALFSGIRDGEAIKPYIVGPIARLNLNYKYIPHEIKSAMKEAGIYLPLNSIYQSIIARTIEVSFAFYEAMRLIKDYEEPENTPYEYKPIHGKTVWITEAPRGMLIHVYELNEKGCIKEARLIPPTSQNLYHMEYSLRLFFKKYSVEIPPEQIKRTCERIVRSYDPCISCSVHMVEI